MKRWVVWRRLLLGVLGVLWVSGCEAATRQLHQVSGPLFALEAPPVQDGFRYGPFATLPRDARFERLVARFRERLAEKHVPGGALAVVIDGKLAYSAGVGVGRSGSPEPVRADSRFRVASLSKMLIAATVLSLVEHDGLRLDRPLTQVLPFFQRGPGYDAAQVTLEMLLNHTGGVPDSDDRHRSSLRALIEAHAHDPLWSPPGRLFNYSNADYALLAAVIEAQTSRPFEQVVSERVLTPSGMRSAGYEAVADLPLVAGHDARGHVVWTRPNDSEASRAAGGVLASVIDFAHFAEALLAHGAPVLSPTSVDAMMRGRAVMQEQPPRLYGYGLAETEHAGLRVVEHSGSAAGFSTWLRLVPDRNFAVIAFDNGSYPPEDVTDAALSAFLDVAETERPRVATPPESWAQYAGFYSDPSGALGQFEVTLRAGKLFMKRQGTRLTPLPATLRGNFVSDASGNVEYFVTRLGVARKRH